MDFMGKVSESINFTLKYKSLWLFGIILGIFGGGGGSSFNMPSNYGDSSSNSYGSSSGSAEFEELGKSIETFFDNPANIALFMCLFIFIVIFALVGWYLTSVAKGALVNSVVLDKKGEEPTFKKGWKFGKSRAFRYILMDLITLLIMLAVFSPLIFVVLIALLGAPIILVTLCLLFPIYFFFIVFWSMVTISAQRLLVLRDLGPWDSLKAGWSLAKENVGDFVVGGFVRFLTGCAWGCIALIIMIIPALVLVVFVAGAIASGNFAILLTVGLIALIVFVIFAAVLNSPFIVFVYTYWTKLVMEMEEKSAGLSDVASAKSDQQDSKSTSQDDGESENK